MEWPAHLGPWDANSIDKDGKVEGRVRPILCGRPTSASSTCDGLVGTIVFHYNVLGLQVYALDGYREVSPGRWEPGGHARKRMKRGSAPRSDPYRTDDGRRVRITPHATVPYTIPCRRPGCRTVAKVGPDVLESAAT